MQATTATKKGPQTVMVSPDLGAAIVAYRLAHQLSTNGEAVRRAFEALAALEGIDLAKLTTAAGFVDEFRARVEIR